MAYKNNREVWHLFAAGATCDVMAGMVCSIKTAAKLSDGSMSAMLDWPIRDGGVCELWYEDDYFGTIKLYNPRNFAARYNLPAPSVDSVRYLGMFEVVNGHVEWLPVGSEI